MKISVIFTGGTIASAEKNGVIAPTEQSGSFLLNSFSSYEEKGVSFQPFYPYTVLSENLSAKHLNSLVGAVIERVNAGDEKIIVCHGSDTLQYSAAAVSFALSGRNACVVFVCSDKPLQAPETNGFINFETAVEFLLQTDLKGVFAAYKNRGETPKILHGARLSSHLEGCDSLYDIFEKPVAVYENGKIILNENTDNSDGYKSSFEVKENPFSEVSGVLAVTAVPGDSFSYDLNGVKAVIMRPYHSGTLNTDSVYFKKFCERAQEMNIPVFAVNVRSGAKYESSVLFENLAVKALPFCSFPAVYIKAWLAKGTKKEITEFMMKNTAGEFAQEG